MEQTKTSDNDTRVKDPKVNDSKEKKRDYGNDYFSVTEILGAIRKIGLEMWYKTHTAQECDEISAKSKEIGTQIHEMIESYVKEKEGVVKTKYKEEVNTGLKSFLKFRSEHPEIKLKWAEQKLTNDDLKLNGTVDCIGEENGDLVIVDWKTGECKEKELPAIYPEYILQVSAYAALYEICMKPKSSIRKAYVIVFAKDKEAYALKEVDSEMLFKGYETFGYLLRYVEKNEELKEMIKKKKGQGGK
ncbi:MAG: PD-(D/E)XK nuclease family protein [Endomicrobium sp.]|jgi:RecB family exonuclease|nr:PD-(D/E)XK nuclease family protein [Endomicrobium sp.]